MIGKENRDLYAKAMKRSVEKCDNLIPVLQLEQFKIDDVMFEIIPSENIISNNIVLLFSPKTFLQLVPPIEHVYSML